MFKIKNFICCIFFIGISLTVFSDHINFNHITSKNGLPHNNIIAIHRDFKGFMWIGSEDGLIKYDGNTFKTYRHNPKDSFSLSNNMIYSITEDKKNRLWITTRHGLNIYDRKMDRFSPVKFLDGDSLLKIESDQKYLITKHSKIWIGEKKNVYRYDWEKQAIDFKLDTLSHGDKIDKKIVFKLFMDSKGRLWVTKTDKCYVVDIDKRMISEISQTFSDQKNPATYLIDATEFKNGDIWLSSFNGIFVLNSDLQFKKR